MIPTLAPSAAKSCAVASPMPEVPPVMTAVLPVSLFMVFSFVDRLISDGAGA